MAIDIRRNYEGKDGPSKEEQQEKLDKLMQEFLAKGGKIQKLEPGAAQGAGGLDRRPHWTDAELKERYRKENGIPDPEKKKKGRKKRKAK